MPADEIIEIHECDAITQAAAMLAAGYLSNGGSLTDEDVEYAVERARQLRAEVWKQMRREEP